jgi:hypothetical protein
MHTGRIGACPQDSNPMNYTILTLRACALTAIPGCYFAYGEKDEANIALVYLATVFLN